MRRPAGGDGPGNGARPFPPRTLPLLLPVTTAAAARTGRAFYSIPKARPLEAFSLGDSNSILGSHWTTPCHSALWPASPSYSEEPGLSLKIPLVKQYVCSPAIGCAWGGGALCW